VSRRDQIVVVDRQIMNGNGGQVQLQGLPVGSVVNREVDAGFGPGKKQSLAFRVFADGAHIRTLGNPMRNGRPRLTGVRGAVDQRPEVIQLVPVDRDVSRGRIEV
jgi:hypothetical protein